MLLGAWVAGANGIIGHHLVRQLMNCCVLSSVLGHDLASVELVCLGNQALINGTVRCSNLPLLQNNMQRRSEDTFCLVSDSEMRGASGPASTGFAWWLQTHVGCARAVLMGRSS
jgi:hypothetical protein